ncbi:MAG: L,D-transpeptidase family protein [Candidatus Omnitrophica bacterium]|nr:L,D-transpeptidase family protein [Candidatus Omnitrophota bacterium]
MKKNVYIVLTSVILIVVLTLTLSMLNRKKRDISDREAGGLATQITDLYDKAKDLVLKEEYRDAKAIYAQLLENTHDEEFAQRVQKDIMELNMRMVFSAYPTDDSIIHTIKKGDTLSGLAKKYNTTVDLIMKSNNLTNDLIRINDGLKIYTASYKVLVDRSQNILTLKSNDSILKTYRVATGINNSTPVGTFKIVNKLKDPVWYRTGAVVPSGSPENILGTRWMGISAAGYGIHGTTQPESIGQHITAGCVRMVDSDVKELYSIVPIGTEVTIIE